jgi:hypothetical protein
MRCGRKYGSNWSCYCFLFEKKTVKRSVQCHLLAQSRPGWHHNDKHPFNTSNPPDLYKNVSLAVLFVTTVIHTQSLRS